MERWPLLVLSAISGHCLDFHHGDVLEYSVTCNSSSELACFSLTSLTGERPDQVRMGPDITKQNKKYIYLVRKLFLLLFFNTHADSFYCPIDSWGEGGEILLEKKKDDL